MRESARVRESAREEEERVSDGGEGDDHRACDVGEATRSSTRREGRRGKQTKKWDGHTERGATKEMGRDVRSSWRGARGRRCRRGRGGGGVLPKERIGRRLLLLALLLRLLLPTAVLLQLRGTHQLQLLRLAQLLRRLPLHVAASPRGARGRRGAHGLRDATSPLAARTGPAGPTGRRGRAGVRVDAAREVHPLDGAAAAAAPRAAAAAADVRAIPHEALRRSHRASLQLLPPCELRLLALNRLEVL